MTNSLIGSLPGSIALHRANACRTSRRRFLARLGLGAAALCGTGLFARGAFAEELSRTPEVTEGPFYPTRLPLDTDNDLLIINDAITSAIGEIAHVTGPLLDARGNPIKNAIIEIWQVDHEGVYLEEINRGQRRQARPDRNFQGFGRFLTGSTGEYYFRTIKPVAYPGRTAPHIHFKIKAKGREPFTTQLYVKGANGNARDGIYRSIGDERARELVTVDFTAIPASRIGELAARFDIVMGFTPEG